MVWLQNVLQVLNNSIAQSVARRTNWSNLVAVTDWGGAYSRFLGLVSVGAARSLENDVK